MEEEDDRAVSSVVYTLMRAEFSGLPPEHEAALSDYLRRDPLLRDKILRYLQRKEEGWTPNS